MLKKGSNGLKGIKTVIVTMMLMIYYGIFISLLLLVSIFKPQWRKMIRPVGLIFIGCCRNRLPILLKKI